ncbi:MAG: hypothetical protein DWQ34_19930, partial [Planctomycetota bacterium]
MPEADEPLSADVRGEVCLGIDPGLNRTGYAILSRFGGSVSLTEGGVVSSTSSRSLAERVHEI